jgi:hypothetical protein
MMAILIDHITNFAYGMQSGPLLQQGSAIMPQDLPAGMVTA